MRPLALPPPLFPPISPTIRKRVPEFRSNFESNSPPSSLDSDLSDIGIELIAYMLYFARENFTENFVEISFFPFFYWFYWSFEKFSFEFPRIRKFFESFTFFFYFFENLSAFREFFTFPRYFCRVRTEDRTTMRVNFFFEGLVARLAGWLIFQPITEGGWNAKTWKRTRRSNDQ